MQEAQVGGLRSEANPSKIARFYVKTQETK
jgi:hypothetical protein